MAGTPTKRKEAALSYFVKKLLSSARRADIARIYLFGSLRKGNVRKDSDVDVLIFCNGRMDEVLDACAGIQMSTYERFSESVEPLVFPLERMRYPDSYFLYRVLENGKEVYSMDEMELKRQEARNYLMLAEEYLEGARENLSKGRKRISLDTAYNAAELCAKALLLLVIDEIPSTRGGIVGELGKHYVKGGDLSRQTGRMLNKALDLRTKARYVWNADISQKDAEDVIEVAESLLEKVRERVGE